MRERVIDRLRVTVSGLSACKSKDLQATRWDHHVSLSGSPHLFALSILRRIIAGYTGNGLRGLLQQVGAGKAGCRGCARFPGALVISASFQIRRCDDAYAALTVWHFDQSFSMPACEG